MYRVDYSKKATKQLRKLDKPIRALLLSWIEKHLENTDNPRLHGKDLTGNLAGLRRYRVGDYRLICEIDDDRLIILALEIGHRKSIYKKLQ